jgi:hypothetical protein
VSAAAYSSTPSPSWAVSIFSLWIKQNTLRTQRPRLFWIHTRDVASARISNHKDTRVR